MAKLEYLLTIFCTFCRFLLANAVQDDIFTEELYIKPIYRGQIYSHFQFTTKWNSSLSNEDSFLHYHLFPKALGEVIKKYRVQELHLSQSQGLWRHKKWGYPIHEAPPGAELWVWFRPSVKNVDKAWAELVNAVSGLFCASLNFLDAQVTVSPRWSFRPKGLAPKAYSVFSHFIRYGALPRELVCTENLTPWKKLLPCDSKAGLAALFNAFYFHDAHFHSLGLHLRSVCADVDCEEEAVELSQSVTVVTDATLKSATGSANWSLRSLFGNHIVSACPLASSSQVVVDTTNNHGSNAFHITPDSSRRVNVTRGGDHHSYEVYDVKALTSNKHSLNVAGTVSQNALPTVDSKPPPIHAHRFITGYGLEKGGIACHIHNTMNTNITVIYMEVLPWFTRLFLNSLVVENNGQKVKHRIHFQPGKDRARPYHLELSFSLWPQSVTKVSFSFRRAFLKWTEYPPDANHGFYLNSAVITAEVPSSYAHTAPSLGSSRIDSIFHEGSISRFPVRIHTESLLVSLPTPDFSMPYNVICLACTVLAVAFGSIHNLTTKRFEKLDPTAKKGLISKLKGLLQRKKSQPETTNEVTETTKNDKDDDDDDDDDDDSDDVKKEQEEESNGEEKTQDQAR